MAISIAGGYSFIIAVEKLKRVCVDWRRVRKEKDIASRKVEELAHVLGKVTKERDLFAREHARLTISLEDLQDLYGELQVDAAKGRKHDAEVAEAIDRLTTKVVEGREREEKMGHELQHQFLEGVKACRDAVTSRYPSLDLGWINKDWDLSTLRKTQGDRVRYDMVLK